MHASRPRARSSSPAGTWRALVVASLAIILAACGGAASPSPSPTPTPTPTPTVAPTPTPIDVGAVFLATVRDPEFSARVALDGTMEMGLSVGLGGTMLFDGDDASLTMTVTFGTTEQTTEAITLNGETWGRTSPGPWLEVETPSTDDSSMTTWLRDLDTLTDEGLETIGGRSLHHLTAGDGPVPLEALGLDPANFTDPDVTVDFYAEPDGTPAMMVMAGTWIQAISGQQVTVEFSLDMTFSEVGSAITIRAPEDVWTTYTSELGYSMAMPAGFTVEDRDGTEVFVDANGIDWAYVYTWQDAAGLSAAGFRDELIDLYSVDWGDPIEAVKDVTLGGEPGYRIVWGFEAEDGSANVAIDTIAMHEVGWEVLFTSLVEERAQVEPIFDTFLATFAYAD